MPRTLSSGICTFCGKEYPKSAMSRHLAACPRRPRGTEERLAIVVQGEWAPEYWLHLEVEPKATLRALDSLLRETWLECCGHMSAFQIDGRSYASVVDDEFGMDDESMDVAAGKILRPGVTGRYVYDFGSSTHLKLRVLGPRLGKLSRDPIRLVARNTPPAFRCKSGHGKPEWVCSCCGEPLCRKCSAKHACGREMLLPIVNSPRVGTCAYGS